MPRRRPRVRARLARKLASPLGMDDWVRVRLGRVGGTIVATPLPRGAGVLTSLVRADGLLVVPAGHGGPPRRRGGRGRAAARPRRDRAHDRRDRLARPRPRPRRLRAARRATPRSRWRPPNVGSLGGLVALRDGLCHLAGSHLLDPATGEYTLPYVDRVLAGRDVSVVRLVHRDQGLIVAPGNPLGLAGVGGPGPPGRALRQPPARRGHPRAARPRAARGGGSARTRSTATRARSPPTWPSRRRSPPGAPTPGWASWRPRGRSASTSCRSPASPTTWWSTARDAGQPAARPAVGAVAFRPVPGRGSGPRRLRHRRRWAGGFS